MFRVFHDLFRKKSSVSYPAMCLSTTEGVVALLVKYVSDFILMPLVRTSGRHIRTHGGTAVRGHSIRY